MSEFQYPHRIAKVREKLRTAETPADAFLIAGHEDAPLALVNTRYLTAFTGSNGYVLLTQDRALFLTDGRYTMQANKQVKGFEIIIVPQGSEMGKIVAEWVEKLSIKSLGFEENSVSVRGYNALAKAIRGDEANPSNVKLVGFPGLVESVRAIKDAEEVQAIRDAMALGDACFTHIQDIVRLGMTEKELAWEMESFLRKTKGAAGMSFESIVGSGPNSAMIHGRPTTRKIGESGEPEFLLLDYGCLLNGYCSDMTRTILVGGAPSEKQQALYDAVLKAQLASLAAIKPGMVGKDVHQVAVDSFKESGFDQYFTHGLGHGLGMLVHDGRAFSATSEIVLEPGMVVTVEPGAYIEGYGGVRIEDVVVVTETGNELLNDSPKELIVLAGK